MGGSQYSMNRGGSSMNQNSYRYMGGSHQENVRGVSPAMNRNIGGSLQNSGGSWERGASHGPSLSLAGACHGQPGPKSSEGCNSCGKTAEAEFTREEIVPAIEKPSALATTGQIFLVTHLQP